ncbi:MAG: aminoacetone oxidase family FAD-binding enzyme, partial [Defluviitaleaceae bacterium]|nr:aminoacetone oxidase family FAD-binding enzyme [Defluviitaleaceae bacterium]
TITEASVSSIKRSESGFVVEYSHDGNTHTTSCGRVIICAGSKSAPALGGNDFGHNLLASLGHTITKTTPALCQLKADTAICKPLKGIRSDCRVTAYSDSTNVAQSEGDVIFAAYGLSGSAIFDISQVCHYHSDIVLTLDFMKEHGRVAIENMLRARRDLTLFPTLEVFFTGIFHKMIGHAILRKSGFENLQAVSSSLTDADISTIARCIKKFEIQTYGHNGYENSQVTAGGALTSQFDPTTMESKLVPGLFATGEVLDIFGDCGGFNLQWAWSSGYIAGRSAAKISQTLRRGVEDAAPYNS